MPSGVVKWFDARRGYGFILPDGGGADLFVHASDIERSGLQQLVQHQCVTYDEQPDRKNGKPIAVNIRRL